MNNDGSYFLMFCHSRFAEKYEIGDKAFSYNSLSELVLEDSALPLKVPEDGYLLLNSNDYRCDAIELKSVDNILPYCDNAQSA